MLKLKQQQLQLMIRDIVQALKAARVALERARGVFEPYRAVLNDVAGIDVEALATPKGIRTGSENVAGVNIPVFEEAVFPRAEYSLFATPPWVDKALLDLREVNRRRAELDIVREQHRLISRELTKITQRVNLFEKVKIPEAQENIRKIRIHLGDEMTAAVGRAKIAKSKLSETGAATGTMTYVGKGREQEEPEQS